MKRLLLIVLPLFLIVGCTSEAERKAEAKRVEAERVVAERVVAERVVAERKAAAEKAAAKAEAKKLAEELEAAERKAAAEKAAAEWVGTFSGVCPEYNMKNKYGENITIMGSYVTIPSVKYTFEIYDNNVSSIYMKSEGGNYSCHNVIYSVSSNNNNFSLTMKPQSGSDCGGNEIIFIKSGGQFKIAAGAKGQPGFILNKTN